MLDRQGAGFGVDTVFASNKKSSFTGITDIGHAADYRSTLTFPLDRYSSIALVQSTVNRLVIRSSGKPRNDKAPRAGDFEFQIRNGRVERQHTYP